MKPTSGQKIMAYRDRQLLIGRRKREAYLTDDEWLVVKAYIKQMRDGKHNNKPYLALKKSEVQVASSVEFSVSANNIDDVFNKVNNKDKL